FVHWRGLRTVEIAVATFDLGQHWLQRRDRFENDWIDLEHVRSSFLLGTPPSGRRTQAGSRLRSTRAARQVRRSRTQALNRSSTTAGSKIPSESLPCNPPSRATRPALSPPRTTRHTRACPLHTDSAPDGARAGKGNAQRVKRRGEAGGGGER